MSEVIEDVKDEAVTDIKPKTVTDTKPKKKKTITPKKYKSTKDNQDTAPANKSAADTGMPVDADAPTTNDKLADVAKATEPIVKEVQEEKVAPPIEATNTKPAPTRVGKVQTASPKMDLGETVKCIINPDSPKVPIISFECVGNITGDTKSPKASQIDLSMEFTRNAKGFKFTMINKDGTPTVFTGDQLKQMKLTVSDDKECEGFCDIISTMASMINR